MTSNRASSMANRVFVRLTAHGRQFEWVSSVALLTISLRLAFPGDTFATAKGFSGLAIMPGAEVAVAVPLAILATVRIIALFTNGMLPPFTHYARQWCSAVAFFVYAAFAVLFELPLMMGITDAPSTAPAMYGAFAFGELLAVWRAAGDARLSGGR